MAKKVNKEAELQLPSFVRDWEETVESGTFPTGWHDMSLVAIEIVESKEDGKFAAKFVFIIDSGKFKGFKTKIFCQMSGGKDIARDIGWGKFKSILQDSGYGKWKFEKGWTLRDFVMQAIEVESPLRVSGRFVKEFAIKRESGTWVNKRSKKQYDEWMAEPGNDGRESVQVQGIKPPMNEEAELECIIEKGESAQEFYEKTARQNTPPEAVSNSGEVPF